MSCRDSCIKLGTRLKRPAISCYNLYDMSNHVNIYYSETYIILCKCSMLLLYRRDSYNNYVHVLAQKVLYIYVRVYVLTLCK